MVLVCSEASWSEILNPSGSHLVGQRASLASCPSLLREATLCGGVEADFVALRWSFSRCIQKMKVNLPDLALSIPVRQFPKMTNTRPTATQAGVESCYE